MRRAVPAVALLLVLAGCADRPSTRHALATMSPKPSSSLTPGIRRHVTGTYPPIGTCHTGTAPNGQLLPDQHCTPGDTDPQVTQANIHATICVRGWTATVRPVESETAAAKARLMRSYGITVDNELDHLVPLELGGASTVKNLWPEVGKVVNNPKDGVESSLNAMVCAHGRHLPLATAQELIVQDWTTAVAVAKTDLVN